MDCLWSIKDSTNALFTVARDSIGKSRGVRAFSIHPWCCHRSHPQHVAGRGSTPAISSINTEPIIDPEDVFTDRASLSLKPDPGPAAIHNLTTPPGLANGEG